MGEKGVSEKYMLLLVKASPFPDVPNCKLSSWFLFSGDLVEASEIFS